MLVRLDKITYSIKYLFSLLINLNKKSYFSYFSIIGMTYTLKNLLRFIFYYFRRRKIKRNLRQTMDQKNCWVLITDGICPSLEYLCNYFYKKNFTNFIFIANSNNIVQATKNIETIKKDLSNINIEILTLDFDDRIISTNNRKLIDSIQVGLDNKNISHVIFGQKYSNLKFFHKLKITEIEDVINQKTLVDCLFGFFRESPNKDVPKPLFIWLGNIVDKLKTNGNSLNSSCNSALRKKMKLYKDEMNILFLEDFYNNKEIYLGNSLINESGFHYFSSTNKLFIMFIKYNFLPEYFKAKILARGKTKINNKVF